MTSTQGRTGRNRSDLLKLLAIAAAISVGTSEALAVSQIPQIRLAQQPKDSSSGANANDKPEVKSVSLTTPQIIDSAATVPDQKASPVHKKSLTINEPEEPGENHLFLPQVGSKFIQPVISLVQSDSEVTEDSGELSQQSTLSKWLQERPYLVVILAVASVVGCCFCSQILLRFSKQCNLSLNRYYIRKRFEKQKMMQNTIQQTRQMRVNQNRQKRQTEERGQGALDMDDAARQSDDMIEEEVDNEGQLELDLPEEEKDSQQIE